jgi:thioredoxin reductase (NADPH)
MKTVHSDDDRYDLVIVGGGVSAFAAALYAGRFDLKTVVVGEKLGGTIILTNDIENYPGFKKISGLELADRIKEHAQEYGVRMLEKKVDRVTRCSEGCLRVYAGDGNFHTKAIIFATGTEWRKLGVPGEAEFTSKGVHYCALCDGPFFRDKVVGVVGGSDSAAKEALLLTEYAKKVYIIYRGDKIRPEPINLKRVMKNKKIEIINNTNVKEIKGDKFVTHVVFDKPYNGSNEFELNGLFVEIGHKALSGLAKSIGVKLNKKGEIMIDKESKTNVEGVFAAGDVADHSFKQAITGVAEGVTAAYSSYLFTKKGEFICVCDDEVFE